MHANMTLYAQLEDLTARFRRFSSSAQIVKYLPVYFNTCTMHPLLFLPEPTNAKLHHKSTYITTVVIYRIFSNLILTLFTVSEG